MYYDDINDKRKTITMVKNMIFSYTPSTFRKEFSKGNLVKGTVDSPIKIIKCKMTRLERC